MSTGPARSGCDLSDVVAVGDAGPVLVALLPDVPLHHFTWLQSYCSGWSSVALGEMQKIAETTMLPIANYCSLLTTATEVGNDSFSQCILGSEILGGYRPRPRTGR